MKMELGAITYDNRAYPQGGCVVRIVDDHERSVFWDFVSKDALVSFRADLDKVLGGRPGKSLTNECESNYPAMCVPEWFEDELKKEITEKEYDLIWERIGNLVKSDEGDSLTLILLKLAIQSDCMHFKEMELISALQSDVRRLRQGYDELNFEHGKFKFEVIDK